MAETLLGGILGEEDVRPDLETSEAPAGATAFAAAVAARLSVSDPEVARDTSIFLRRRAHLLEIQKQGKAQDAIGKYEEALRYAPNWKELKDARRALSKRSFSSARVS